MTEPPTEAGVPRTEQQTSPGPEKKSSGKGLLLGGIALVLVAAVTGWAGYIYVTGKDGFSWKRFAFQDRSQKLVPVTGELYFNGEPLTHGTIQAYAVDANVKRLVIGPIGKDGKFKLMTDIDGLFTDGAAVGTYKIVLVVNYPSRPGQLAPDPMLPKEYYDETTTPITFEVTSDPEKNHFVRKLKGELRPRPAGWGKGKGGKKGKKRPSANEIIDRVFQSDKNGDGKISRDEAPDRLKSNFDTIDSDKDGQISKDELRSSLQRAGGGKQGGRRAKGPGGP